MKNQTRYDLYKSKLIGEKNTNFVQTDVFIDFRSEQYFKLMQSWKSSVRKWEVPRKKTKIDFGPKSYFFTDVYLFADSIQSSVCPLVDRNPHISVSQILEIENEIETVIWSFSLMILHLWGRFEHSNITSE